MSLAISRPFVGIEVYGCVERPVLKALENRPLAFRGDEERHHLVEARQRFRFDPVEKFAEFTILRRQSAAPGRGPA